MAQDFKEGLHDTSIWMRKVKKQTNNPQPIKQMLVFEASRCFLDSHMWQEETSWGQF